VDIQRVTGQVLTASITCIALPSSEGDTVSIEFIPIKSYVVLNNCCIPKAKAVDQWLASPPRFAVLWLPTYCPRANPIERACGDVHDKCTRNHTRKRLYELVRDVEQHRRENGPWQSTLSQLYEAPEVTAAVERIATEKQLQMAA